MLGALYVAAYWTIRKLGEDGVKRERVSPVIREITAKLPEPERQAKADELWRDEQFVEKTIEESYREKTGPSPSSSICFGEQPWSGSAAGCSVGWQPK